LSVSVLIWLLYCTRDRQSHSPIFREVVRPRACLIREDKAYPSRHPRFWLKTPGPNPQSQSLSLSYGSVLPTSLTYIFLLTRGCSPRRPDAVMSTDNLNATWAKFSRSFGWARNASKAEAPFQSTNHIAEQFDSVVSLHVRKKRKLSFGHPLACLAGLCYHKHQIGSGFLTWFSFGTDVNAQWLEFPIALEPTYPCPIAVHMEPFSTSVFKVRIWILATSTKICTSDGFSRVHTLPYSPSPRPPTHSINFSIEWCGISRPL